MTIETLRKDFAILMKDIEIKEYVMKILGAIVFMSFVIVGCDSGGYSAAKPTLREIEDGFQDSMSCDAGIPQSCMSVKATDIGSGRWAVRMTATRYDGQQRTLDATAVMDKNGDIHYYTD